MVCLTLLHGPPAWPEARGQILSTEYVLAAAVIPNSTAADLQPTIPRNPPASRPSNYLPTLDGWRAIAILIVLLDHGPTLHLGRWNTEALHSCGDAGVEIFFAISGLLICSRLLDQEERTGRLGLKSFYVRRLFRIQPAALVYLGAVLLLTLVHRLPAFPDGLLAALLLVRNYVGMQVPLAISWPTAHYWSLSVEEHFYCILPPLLWLLPRWRARILLVLAAFSLVWFAWLTRHAAENSWSLLVRTEARLWFLLFPAAIAILLRRDRWREAAQRHVRTFLVLTVAALALPPRSPIHADLLAISSFLVVSTMLHPETVLSRLLELAPLRFVGRISYSLYLWQQLFLTQTFAPSLHPFGRLHESLLVWPALFATAIVSYSLVEKPCIRLGHRLARSTAPA